MILTPSSLTLDYLSSLKFKELRKLSQQFNVSKRWAKKQELINNLLAINSKKNFKIDENTNKEEMSNKDWKDGSIVFCDLKVEEKDNNKIDKRLTFTLDKCSRLTFDIPQNKSFLFSEKNKKIDTGETFDIASKPSMESRATYEVSKKVLLNDETFSKTIIDTSNNNEKLFHNTQNNLIALYKKHMSINEPEKSCMNSLMCHTLKHEVSTEISAKKDSFAGTPQNDQKLGDFKQSNINILENPHTKVTKRAKKHNANLKSNESLIKISHKSINIKKSKLPTKIELLKSPVSLGKLGKRQPGFQLVPKTLNKNVLSSKVPISTEKKVISTQNSEDKKKNNKENEYKGILKRKKSKTADEILIKTSNIPKVNFMSPTLCFNNKYQAPPSTGKTNSKKESKNVLHKPIVAKKMPDFTKIHQKHFEQMDSLQDYLKKKEERTRKLFGTPCQKSEEKVPNGFSTVFRFQSPATTKLKNKYIEKHDHLRNINFAQKETVMKKIPSSKLHLKIKDKDERRSHINGVRTNKRFELQMKLRHA